MGIADLFLRPLRSRVVTSSYPSSGDLPDRGHRGTPSPGSAAGASEWDAAGACPVAAITTSDGPGVRALAIDYGKCLFCGNCVQNGPAGELRSGNEFELAGRTRESVQTTWSIAADGGIEAVATAVGVLGEVIGRKLRRSLHIRHLDSGSCNGCDWEMTALLKSTWIAVSDAPFALPAVLHKLSLWSINRGFPRLQKMPRPLERLSMLARFNKTYLEKGESL